MPQITRIAGSSCPESDIVGNLFQSMKSRILYTWLVTCAVAAAAAGAIRQAGPQSAERETTDLSLRGPQVGDAIPNFALEDQFGRPWTRASILGPNGTMLVFLHSADW